MTIKHLLLNSLGGQMCDKMAISAHILKIVENDPFLRLQMTSQEMFNHHQCFLLSIFIYGGVHIKGQIQTQNYGFTANSVPKNIVILHIFYPKIWVTTLF